MGDVGEASSCQPTLYLAAIPFVTGVERGRRAHRRGLGRLGCKRAPYRLVLVPRDREGEAEPRSDGETGLIPNAAAHRFHQTSGDGKAKAKPGVGPRIAGRDLLEPLEDPVPSAFGDPLAVVGDHEDPGVVAGESLHRDAIATVLSGVLQQVAEHLLHAVGVGMHDDVARHRNRRLFWPARREQKVGDLECAWTDGEVGHFECEATRFEARDRQHIVDEVLEVLRLADDECEEFIDLFRFEPAPCVGEGGGEPGDRSEGRAQLGG